ncbi:MAG: hypothetical protein M1820_005475 [Bogoriella megaspora]|nr:MAG: hypothetical protein M1820_005475 [Bogoriella megaspora]
MPPPFLSHPDFGEINISIDSDGHVTGVIDFEDAESEALAGMDQGEASGMCRNQHSGKHFGVY